MVSPVRVFGRLSIKWKLVAVVVVLTAFGFGLATIGLIADHRRSARNTLVDNVSILAEVVGDNCRAALVFADRGSAEETLAALNKNAHVRRAVLYDDDGAIFATYPSGDPGLEASGLPPDGHRIDDDLLSLHREIELDGKHVGTLLIQSDLEVWEASLATFVKVSAILFLAILLVTFLLTMRLQRLITDPIHELAGTVRRVSASGQYGIRARRLGDDELGELVAGFNGMLDAIQSRDADLIRAAEDLETHVAALEASNTELEQFAYVASHDLQEPLRGIAGCLQLLERRHGEALDEQGKQLIAFSVDGANRLKALINDLLDYSRVNRRKKPMVPVDCETVYRDVLANLSAAIAEADARVSCDALPTVTADASQLPLVFQNLISNALKFRAESPPRIHVSSDYRDGEWVFSVRDNGIGIDDRFQKRIFDIFQRLHTTAEYEGTGIGLAISKKIVERHAGRIWVESRPGQGTCFHFSIADRRRAAHACKYD